MCGGTEGDELDEEGDVLPGQILPGLHLLSTDGVRAMRLGPSVQIEPDSWIPFASTCPDDFTFSGMLLMQDRTVSHWSWVTHQQLTPEIAPSLGAYLGFLAEALESGAEPLVTAHHVPGLALGALVWGDPSSPPHETWIPVHR